MTGDPDPVPPADVACPSCGWPVGPQDNFCEACRAELAPAVDSGEDPVAAAECPFCQSAQITPDGYCEACGRKLPSSRDHTEIDHGMLAGVTDRGLRRGQRRLIRAPGAGDPVAHHRHRGRAVGQLRGRERHRVLVAVMPQAAIADPGQHPEIDLGVITAGRQLAAARLAVTIRGDLRGLTERARGGPDRILAADHSRGEFRPARFAEIVLRADRPAARRARDLRGRRRVRIAGHAHVPGRTWLARSTSSIRRRSSGACRAWAR